MSGQERLHRNRSFVVNVWKTATEDLSSFSASGLITNRCTVTGVAASPVVLLGASLSSRCTYSVMSIMTLLFWKKSRVIPKYDNFVPRWVGILIYGFSSRDMTSSTTDCLTCEIFKLSTFQTMVHLVPSIILFPTHVLYGFSTNPIYLRTFERCCQKSNPLFKHQYKALGSLT